MKRWLKTNLAVCLTAMLLSGCGSGQETEDRQEVEFTVVAPDEAPEALAAEIEANKQGEIRMAYTDGGFLYLIRGYGEQKTGGYSIQVKECTEDETTVYLDTQLLGPSGQTQLSQEPSWPYIVLKMEEREKDVQIR